MHKQFLKKEIFLKYSFFLIPLIFLFKHNIATLLLIILSTSLIFYYKQFFKIINSTNNIIHIFFIYIFLNGIINLNIENFFYLRFYFLILLINYLLNFDDLIKYKNIILITLFFTVLDGYIQKIYGFNLVGIENSYITSFFKDEKILGSYIFKLTTLFLILSLFFNNKKYIFSYLILIPVFYYLLISTGQRIALVNFSIFSILLIFYFMLNYKVKGFIFGSLLIILISAITAKSIDHKKNIFDRVNEVLSKDLKKQVTSIHIKNTNNFLNIKLNDKTLSKNFIKYEDIFAYGFNNDGKIQELTIQYFYPKITRLSDHEFSIDPKSPSATKIADYYNIKASSLNFKDYLNFYEKNNKLALGEEIISFETKDLFEKKISDNAWLAHSIIAKNIFLDNPIFGVGLKNYRHKCYDEKYRKFDSLMSNWCTTHPHNYFIEIISELGLVGIILFGLIIFSLIRKIYKNRSIRPNNRILIILIVLQIFNPIQITGRMFSSVESWYYISLIIILHFLGKENNNLVVNNKNSNKI